MSSFKFSDYYGKSSMPLQESSASADVVKLNAQADALVAALNDLNACADLINPHMHDDMFSRRVNMKVEEIRSHTTSWKASAASLK